MAIDWLDLWRELVVANTVIPNSEQVKRYKKHVAKKEDRPDTLLDSVLKAVDGSMTVLDIGPGNGRWTIPLAKIAKAVTAVDPSKDMLDILRENAKAANVNIRTVQSTWEKAEVKRFDIVVCAHAMYSSPDFALFVHKMEQNARKSCYMAIRLPPADGIIGQICKAIYGRVYDSPNAVIAFNALYSLGIYSNVMMENDILHWMDDNLEEAFLRVKKHLHLESDNMHDDLIKDALRKRLFFSHGRYIWPDGMRSALFWWNPKESII